MTTVLGAKFVIENIGILVGAYSTGRFILQFQPKAVFFSIAKLLHANNPEVLCVSCLKKKIV